MDTALARLTEFVASIQPRTRKRVLWTIGILFVLQLYFVRELIAAELLFGAIFAALFLLAGICYLIGAIGVNGLDWAEAGARVVSSFARRSYSALEEFGKRSFRYLTSESAR